MMLMIVILTFSTIASAWHGYNYSFSRLEDRSECPDFIEATRPYKHELIERLGLWPNLMSQFDIEYGETLYGSKEGLELIWKNQNPEDCSKAKFLISGGWPYGFGSRVHMEGAALGMAMHLGRVYLPHPDGDNFFFETQIEFCRNSKRFEPGMNCFYAAYSKCTIKDATASVGGDVNKLRSYYMGDFRAAFADETGLDHMIHMLEGMKGITLIQTYGGGPYDLHTYIPHQMRPLIDCSPMRQGAEYYWWRAVSATFITRPNKETLAMLAQHSTLPLQDYSDVITMFVRHGDKGIEMKLIDFTEYARVAQLLWDRGLVPMSAKYLEQVTSSQPRTLPVSGTEASSAGGGDSSSGKSGSEELDWYAAAAAGGNGRSRRRTQEKTSNQIGHRRQRRGRRLQQQPISQNEKNRTAHDIATSNRNGGSDGASKLKRLVPGGGVTSPKDNIYGAPVVRAVSAKEAASLPRVPYNGTIFLTTEDPAVIKEANAWGARNHWTVTYTNLFDRATQTAMKTWDEQHKRGAVAVHDKLEYISMLVNLYYSLRSEAYVCTLRSNSCRIIDELRATIGGKANRFYADLSVESCPHPPCLDTDDEVINWGE